MLTNLFISTFNEQIKCAQTLASRFYTDPAILEIEKSRIFSAPGNSSELSANPAEKLMA